MPDAVPPNCPALPEADVVAALGGRALVLVGMMGAGKTTIGRRIAARLRLPFADADVEIEAAHAGMTIPEMFAKFGEPYFRDGEAKVIARLLGDGPRVLATGGGAYMREETRRRIRDHAVSLWLRVERDVILRRVRRRADRPLLQTDDPAATIDRLIAERHPLYREADIMVPSRDVPHEKIVDECIAALRGWLGRERAAAAEGISR